eukprot:c18202_g1_i1 orf=263-1090(-)
MGGHGGLNILPQKRWNVYNYDNRERVRRDEEEAAQEEYIRKQAARQRDAEVRLEKLREVARGRKGLVGKQIEFRDAGIGEEGVGTRDGRSAADNTHVVGVAAMAGSSETERSGHINFFEGGFEGDSLGTGGSKNEAETGEEKKKKGGGATMRRIMREASNYAKHKTKKVAEPEDERYRLGYGSVEKDSKRPWYLTKSSFINEPVDDAREGRRSEEASEVGSGKRKKSLDELREERLTRERQERERAQRLLFPRSGGSQAGRKNIPYYNSSFGNAR